MTSSSLPQAYDVRELGRLPRRRHPVDLLVLAALGSVRFDRARRELLFRLLTERYDAAAWS